MNGAPLRRLLLRALAHAPVAVRRAGPMKRILLIRPDHLGDLLFMTPALHALRSALPDARITCLVGPWGEPVLAGNPDVDAVLTCDFPWFNRRPKTSLLEPYTVLRREAAGLRRLEFDLAIIMRFDFWWGAALARLAGIPRRVGYALPDVQPFLTLGVPYQAGLHEVEQNVRLVGQALLPPQVLPVRPGDAPLCFDVSAADAAWAAEALSQVESPAQNAAAQPASAAGVGPYVAIHAGAGARVKLWPANGWVAVATELARRHGATIVLTGGSSEVGDVAAIASRLAVPCINLAGQTSLGQLAAVFARCRLVMGPDSGPLHLAVAVGAPTVHLFGPIDPRLFGPWGDPARQVVVQARFFADPCHGQPCNRLDYTAEELAAHPCMQTITAADVLGAAAGVLEGVHATSRG